MFDKALRQMIDTDNIVTRMSILFTLVISQAIKSGNQAIFQNLKRRKPEIDGQYTIVRIDLWNAGQLVYQFRNNAISKIDYQFVKRDKKIAWHKIPADKYGEAKIIYREVYGALKKPE